MPDSLPGHDHGRQNDVLIKEFIVQMKEQSIRFGELTAQVHSLEVQVAVMESSLKGRESQIHTRIDHAETRLTQIEDWRGATNKQLSGIAISVILIVIAAVIGLVFTILGGSVK